MFKSVHVLIVGGGISGLTLANLLIHDNKKVKFCITIFESQSYHGNHQESLGGGIGLWPPSQSVLKNIPNYQNFIEQFGYCMPFPSYRDSKGRILARANEDFGDRFPVQCLNRDDLISLLSAGLKNETSGEIDIGPNLKFQANSDWTDVPISKYTPPLQTRPEFRPG